MTRPKMTGKCTVQEFWIEVAHFGWGTKTTDHRAIKREMLERYDDVFLKTFEEIYDELESKLYARVERWEKENDENSECGDDGFGDLISHCVGLGDQYYALCMENPHLVVERGRQGRYTEKFSYSFPTPARAPEETLEEAIEHVRARREADRACWEEPGIGDDDHILREALTRILGDRVFQDPRYYGAWARSARKGLEELLDSEFGIEFNSDLTFVVSAFADISKNEVEPTLPRLAEVLEALERIEAKREEIVKDFERRLSPLHAFSHPSCQGVLVNIRNNFIGEPEEEEGA